jgi:hypothetical protein
VTTAKYHDLAHRSVNLDQFRGILRRRHYAGHFLAGRLLGRTALGLEPPAPPQRQIPADTDRKGSSRRTRLSSLPGRSLDFFKAARPAGDLGPGLFYSSFPGEPGSEPT